MAYQQKPGDGTLFKAEKKSDKSPDYTGTILTLDGKKLRLAAWVKEGNKGKFLSIKMSEPQEKKDNGGDLPF